MGICMKNYKDRLLGRLLQKHTRNNTLCVLLSVLALTLPVYTISIQSYEIEPVIPQESRLLSTGWTHIDSGVTQDLNNVFFICLNRGTIVGDEGVILRSGDGGNNWVAQNSGVMENLYGVSYYGYNVILAVGTSGTILLTNNSGTNWTTLQTGMMGTYFSCQMVNETVGVAVGVNAIFQPFFTRTNDGWDTWESSSFYIEHDSVFYEGRLTDVFFLNTSVGLATAIVDIPMGGAIVRTTDGGSTWETVLFYNEALLSIGFTNESIGYAVGDHGTIVQTSDGGQSWQQGETGVSTLLWAVDFTNQTSGTVVGDNGIILRTENGGSDWIQQSSGTPVNLLSLQYVTDRFGIVVGEQGVILRTETGGNPEDVTPPETICTISGTLVEDVYISDVLVTLNATDDITGVDTTMYKLDEALWETYSEPFSVTKDGSHLLRFYSIDNAGNIEEEKTYEFTIQHPPNLQITMTGGFGIKIQIKNLGSTNLTNEPWNLSLQGGIILFGKQRTGDLTINAAEEITLNALVFGIGKPTMTFTIASTQKTVEGTVFLFFVRF